MTFRNTVARAYSCIGTNTVTKNIAKHKSAYLFHGIGLTLPATPRSADKAKGAMAMRDIEPAGVVGGVVRRRTILGTKANVLMTRSERVEPSDEIVLILSMVCIGVDASRGGLQL